jgi:hypothetical protein
VAGDEVKQLAKSLVILHEVFKNLLLLYVVEIELAHMLHWYPPATVLVQLFLLFMADLVDAVLKVVHEGARQFALLGLALMLLECFPFQRVLEFFLFNLSFEVSNKVVPLQEVLLEVSFNNVG